MSEAMRPVQYGVDLITFYHPQFWGLSTDDEVFALRQSAPERVWSTILDGLVAAEVQQIELTFGAADWTGAVEVFGSAAGFRAELESRGLSVMSSFYSGEHNWTEATTPAQAADEIAPLAEFLGEVGAGALVVGLPMRSTLGSQPPRFADLQTVQPIVDIVHRVAHTALASGVKTALHTEAHSLLYTARDIGLFMTLTDPEYVWLCPDTAHITLGGVSPVEAVSPVRERVLTAHWKDALGPVPPGLPIGEGIHESHREFWTGMGSGVVDWAEWARFYDTTAGAETILLELDAALDPVAEMIAARTVVENVRSRS